MTAPAGEDDAIVCCGKAIVWDLHILGSPFATYRMKRLVCGQSIKYSRHSGYVEWFGFGSARVLQKMLTCLRQCTIAADLESDLKG